MKVIITLMKFKKSVEFLLYIVDQELLDCKKMFEEISEMLIVLLTLFNDLLNSLH